MSPSLKLLFPVSLVIPTASAIEPEALAGVRDALFPRTYDVTVTMWLNLLVFFR
jgi:hypothetical protein